MGLRLLLMSMRFLIASSLGENLALVYGLNAL